jgi:hypothetical protein
MRDDMTRVSLKSRVPKTEMLRTAMDALIRAYDEDDTSHSFRHDALFPGSLTDSLDEIIEESKQ